MLFKKVVLSLSLVFCLAIVANAQAKPVQIQKNQQKRIKQGVKSGELTAKEAYQLEKQQVKIQKQKRRAKADGVVTKKEKVRLKKSQAAASKNIYKKKHNERDRN